MPVSRAIQVIEKYGLHQHVIHGLVDGISHEESMLQLPFDANCMNWVLGHIAANRSHVLEVIGLPHGWQNEVRNLYNTDTAPVKPDSTCLKIETLLQYIDESMILLTNALGTVSEAWLEERFTNYRGEKTREGHLLGFHWHETYHVGQLEIFKDFAMSKRK